MIDIEVNAEQRKPYHRLFGIYLLVSAPALLFAHRPPTWLLILVIHLLGAAWAFQLGPFKALTKTLHQRLPRLTGFVADWYLLALIPVLYTELATLNLAVWNGHFFDDLIIGWEQAIFRGQPSTEWSRQFDILPLSEFLHAAYISYYLIIFGPPIALYAMGRRDAQRSIVFAIMFTFFVHYLFFIYFPVQGPRYLFPAPTGEISQGAIFGLTHKLLEAGSSQGAAFPSSHVGVATAQTLMTFKLLPRWGPVIAIMSVALALGAIYGGFHYATDASAGLLLGVIAVMAAPYFKRLLTR